MVAMVALHRHWRNLALLADRDEAANTCLFKLREVRLAVVASVCQRRFATIYFTTAAAAAGTWNGKASSPCKPSSRLIRLR